MNGAMNKHKEEFEDLHHNICDILILWLNLQLSNVQYESKASLSLKFMKFPDDDGPFNDMAKFIEEYVQNRKGVWYALDYIYTDYVSEPLSVYYGMYYAGLFDLLNRPIYTIHIVQADSIEKNGLPAWEILLHLFPNIEVLIVVLVGKTLQFEFGMQDICPHCIYNGKKFIYECCSMIYSDYMINPMYRTANLIIGFQIILKSALYSCIKTMQSQDCPVLFTTMSEDIALGEAAAIQNMLGIDVWPVIGIKNKFVSLRPHRTIKYIYYRNVFLIVYKTLKNASSAIQSNSTICI
ncbi:uncharacterized protein LOC105185070 [Harpegnathos saltator]|uniref:uncharacterized protein LOC105185070 n=1 Tax=Harpegnathos saltator TaxID=610380 RepID=UPI000DBEDC52|nr:uncharacterized protein LOC105185070 [Harpegnathos saltator]